MIVELMQPVWTAKEVSDFLGALPEDIFASNIRMEWRSDNLYCVICIEAKEAYAIDCGDHVPNQDGNVPQDILLVLHAHDKTD